MNKFLKIFAVSVILSGVGFLPSKVSAQQVNCDNATIQDTGAGSTNEIICQDETTIVIQCSNNTIIRVNIDQNSDTGGATNGENTNSLGSTTGDAANDQATDIDIDALCAEQTPITPVTTITTPTTPATTNPQPTIIKKLPKTGETTLFEKTLIGAVSLLGLSVIASTSLRIYRRLGIK